MTAATAWWTTEPHGAIVGHDPRWMPSAGCRGVDPALFFPGLGEDTGPAKAVCRGCPVRAECAEFALDTVQREGVWVGLSERERRRLRRARRVRAA